MKGFPLVIDSHTHIFPDKIARGAVEHLSALCGLEPAYPGSGKGLLANMQESGITASINAPIATKPEQVDSINVFALTLNGPIYSLGTVHPDNLYKKKILANLLSNGVMGIKLHPEYQNFRLDDPRMNEIWSYCSDNGLPVLIHCGCDLGFPSPWKSGPFEASQLQKRFPALRLIAAHFGGFSEIAETEKYLIGTETYLDLSFASRFTSLKKLASLCKQHNPERILFASDAPWQNPVSALKEFLSMDFTPKEQELILHSNSAKLFNINL